MWWIVLLTSVGLIGIGAGLLIRDFFTSKLERAERAAKTPDGAEFQPAGSAATFAADADRLDGHGSASLPAVTTKRTATATAPRLPAMETQWPQLRPSIDAAVAAINQSMASIDLFVGTPGEPTWSLHNRGFGDYRRILIGGESVAWLRMELCADMSISAVLRAHDAHHTALNRTSTIDRPLIASRLATALTECLSAAAETASWLRHSKAVPPPPPPRAPATNASAVANRTTTPPTQPTRTTTGWGRSKPATNPAVALIDAAILLVNGAIQETGARLVPAREPVRREPIGPHDRALSIDVAGISVGLMLIEPFPDRVDISVGVSDLANFGAARRQSKALRGLTVHPLAETIATCAWPAIASVVTPAARQATLRQ